MSARARLRRAGIALAIAGLFLGTFDVDPAGEVARALAETAVETPAPSEAPSPDAAAAGVAMENASPAPVASPEAEKPAAGADLTHLAFTATGTLTASLIAPAPDTVAAADTTSLEVETVRGAGVELKVGGAVVPFSRIGRRVVDNASGITRYTYYGVALEPGPNAIELTPLGAEGTRGPTSAVQVYGPGRPATLTIAAHGPLRADGTTTNEIVVQGRDRWGHPASGSVVQVVVISGDARLARNGDGASPAASVPVALATTSPASDPHLPVSVRQSVSATLGADGTATLKLIPGMTAGDLVLRALCDSATRDARVFLAPNLRKPFVSGLVTAGAGAVPGIPNESSGEPDGANARRARVAVFGTGAVGKSLATFAYDTANTLRRTPEYGGSYADDSSDRPYLVSGDTSIVRDDALSRDHLFARLDTGRTTAQWGEFRARTSANDGALGGFDQLVDGAKVELNGQTQRASLFAARNDVGYDRRVFAPSGLANGVVLRPGVVVGSDILVLTTIDLHTGAILLQTPLTRGVDYTIEYATGQIRFIDLPLPFDEAFNPRQIVLTYEYNAPGNAAQTIGGRAETTFGGGHALRLGVGYVNDSSGAGNITLASQDLGGTLAGGAWNVTHATSHGALLATSAAVPITSGGGDALHASLNQTAGTNRLSFLFDRTSTGYNDPFGGLSTPGLLNERLTFAHALTGGRGELSFDLGHQSNTGLAAAGNTQTNAVLRARRAFSKRLALTASLERRIASSAAGGSPIVLPTPAPFGTPSPGTAAAPLFYQQPPAESSTQASVGFDWRAASNLDVSLNRIATVSGSNAVTPAQTDAQFSYDLGKSGRAYIRERWSASPVQSFAAATQSFTGATGGTRSTQFGFARQVGAATSIESTWSVDHTANGNDVYAAIGGRERFKFGRTTGDLSFQHAVSAGDAVSGAGFNLYGLALNYADPSGRFRASGSSQLRTGTDGGISVTVGALGALSPEISAFAVIDDARTAGSNQSDERAGFAWRPSRTDAGVTLFQYEQQDGTSTLNQTQSGVLSLEQVVRVRNRTTFVARYAYKINGDSTYAAHSSLFGLRLDQTVGSRFDAGAEVRQSGVHGIAGTTATALALEGGIRLGNSTRLGAGYNFTATADPSLATAPVRRGAYLTITSVVDRLFGWGKR